MMTDSYQKWLDELKLGALVVVEPSGLGESYKTRVERFTRTLIILHNGRRFRRKDGIEPGGVWHSTMLREPTTERLSEIRRTALVLRLRGLNWSKRSLEVLEAVDTLITGA